MKIKRDDFLRVLEMVQFGVAHRETVAQSRCFCFRGGTVMAYDDEVLCQAPSGLDRKIQGAVEAQRLLGVLRKLPDAELDLQQQNGEMILKGKRKADYFRVEKEVRLPVDQVETPKEWLPLPEGFSEAVTLVQECAREKSPYVCRTYVHITPKYLQAYDGLHLIRYRLRMGITGDYILVRKAAIKNIASLGMHEFSETPTWVHFRSPAGLVYSCRRWGEEYPDLSQFFKVKGEAITLPRGLDEGVSRAREFTQELADSESIRVDVKQGRVSLTGTGITGRHEEYRPIKDYQGGEYSFLITPLLLENITKKYSEAELTKEMLIVRGPCWTYIAALVDPNEVEETPSQEGEESSEESQNEE